MNGCGTRSSALVEIIPFSPFGPIVLLKLWRIASVSSADALMIRGVSTDRIICGPGAAG